MSDIKIPLDRTGPTGDIDGINSEGVVAPSTKWSSEMNEYMPSRDPRVIDRELQARPTQLEAQMGSMVPGQTYDPNFIPMSEHELDMAWTKFRSKDIGNGRYIQVNQDVMVYENGAVWHRLQGRLRGPIPTNSPRYPEHRINYIKFHKDRINKLTKSWQDARTGLSAQLKIAMRNGKQLPHDLQQRMQELERKKERIDQLRKELEIIMEPERRIQWEEEQFRAEDRDKSLSRSQYAKQQLQKLESMELSQLQQEQPIDEE